MVGRWTEAKSVGAEPGSRRESREGKREAQNRWFLVDTNHSLAICPFFIFRRGYPFFGYPCWCCRATFMSDECQTNVRQARIDCKMTSLESHQTLVFMGFCRFAYAKGVQNDVRRMSDECQEGEIYRGQAQDEGKYICCTVLCCEMLYTIVT